MKPPERFNIAANATATMRALPSPSNTDASPRIAAPMLRSQHLCACERDILPERIRHVATRPGPRHIPANMQMHYSAHQVATIPPRCISTSIHASRIFGCGSTQRRLMPRPRHVITTRDVVAQDRHFRSHIAHLVTTHSDGHSTIGGFTARLVAAHSLLFVHAWLHGNTFVGQPDSPMASTRCSQTDPMNCQRRRLSPLTCAFAVADNPELARHGRSRPA